MAELSNPGAPAKPPILDPLIWAVRAAVVFLGHLGLALIIIFAIWATEHAMTSLWGLQEPPQLFGRLPLKYLFDCSHLSVLGLFTVWGAIEANHQLRKA